MVSGKGQAGAFRQDCFCCKSIHQTKGGSGALMRPSGSSPPSPGHRACPGQTPPGTGPPAPGSPCHQGCLPPGPSARTSPSGPLPGSQSSLDSRGRERVWPGPSTQGGAPPLPDPAARAGTASDPLLRALIPSNPPTVEMGKLSHGQVKGFARRHTGSRPWSWALPVCPSPSATW